MFPGRRGCQWIGSLFGLQYLDADPPAYGVSVPPGHGLFFFAVAITSSAISGVSVGSRLGVKWLASLHPASDLRGTAGEKSGRKQPRGGRIANVVWATEREHSVTRRHRRAGACARQALHREIRR
jgi:hypothetical protein